MMPTKRRFWLHWLALVLVVACDAKESPASELSCQPERLGAPATIQLGNARSGAATWLLADGELVAVTPGDRSRGYAISQLGVNGEPSGESWTVLPDEVVESELVLAAVGGVLAIAEVAHESGGNHRPFCRLSLLRLKDHMLVRPALHVSDPTEDASIVHEAQSCLVAAAESEFVVAWQQYTSRDSDDSGIFAQRIAADGSLHGERMTLLEKTPGKQADLAAAGDGKRVLVAYRGADQSETTLAFIAQDAWVKRPLARVDTPIRALAAAHGGMMLRTSSSLWLLDADGQMLHGPYALDPQALVAPLGEGYVVIDHDEYLVARALAGSSQPLGISDDRGAFAQAVLFTPNAETTALIYGDGEAIKLVKLGCGGKPGPVGPSACAHVSDLKPLDPGCDDEVCHVVMRFDYLTLGARGWSVRAGPAQPVGAAQAELAAKAVFDANSEYLVNPLHVSGPGAGLYYVMHDPSDFGGFALVSQQSGVVVAAGGIVWSGRGSYWVPDAWRPAEEIKCGETLASPSSRVLDREMCAGDARTGTTPDQAMAVALSTNLAQAIAAQGAFTARAYLYTPTVGECDSRVAEWLVILTRQ